MKRHLGKAMWYLGLGYLTTVLGFTVLVYLIDDSFWSNSDFKGAWYQVLGAYFIIAIGFYQMVWAPFVALISATIGAVLFCSIVLVKKVTSAFKSVYEGT